MFDTSVLIEIIDLFFEEYPSRLEILQHSIETKDYPTLKFAAHSLKGVISNFCAKTLQEQAKELEFLAIDKVNDAGTGVPHEVFVGKLEELKASLTKFLDDLGELKKELAVSC